MLPWAYVKMPEDINNSTSKAVFENLRSLKLDKLQI